MAISRAHSGVYASPNVTPMIDVMLVLLIIFMIVAPLLNAGIRAEPPVGVNLKSHPEESPDQVLGIDASGQYYLNRVRIANASLGDRLKEVFDARASDKILYVKADKNLAYSKVLDAVDVASRNGVRVVGAIATQQTGTESSVDAHVSKPLSRP